MQHGWLATGLGGAALCLAAHVAATQASRAPVLGYKDTPMLRGLPYQVHDPQRPHAPVVTPPSTPGGAPSDAVVCLTAGICWRRARSGGSEPARWKVEGGHMEVVPGAGDLASREEFGDCLLHIEWAAPAKVSEGSQEHAATAACF